MFILDEKNRMCTWQKDLWNLCVSDALLFLKTFKISNVYFVHKNVEKNTYF